MSSRRATGVQRHTLKFEGAPFDDRGNRIVLGRWAGVGGVGRAMCSCGELSQDFSSSSQRQGWHRRHKHLKRVEAFLTMFAEGRDWPFTEDDRANITGFGHQDPEEFAQALTDYDRAIWGTGETDGSWTANDVNHKYATFDFVEDDLANIESKDVTPDTHPDCVAITTVWGQR